MILSMINLFGLYFNFWVLLLFLVGGLFITYLWRRKKFFAGKTLFYSNVHDLDGDNGYNLSALPFALFSLSLVFFALASIDPHIFTEREGDDRKNPPTLVEGIAIYLVLDKSGSMAEEVATPGQSGRKDVKSKLALMKVVTAKFIDERPTDLIGIVAFARQADVMVPLTLDHASVSEALDEIQQIPNKEMDGTAIGYAIYKTVSLIDSTKNFITEKKENTRSAYEIKNNVIILVTDGLQDPNPLDQGNRLRTIGLDEAAKYAEEKGVKLYIINVDPKIATQRYVAQRRQLERITQLTGGRFYIVDSAKGLENVYTDINHLEKSLLPSLTKELLPEIFKRYSFSPWLITLGLAAFMTAIICKTLIFRRVP